MEVPYEFDDKMPQRSKITAVTSGTRNISRAEKQQLIQTLSPCLAYL
jgi:hypothetical protein